MSESTFNTALLANLADRIRAGDKAARDEFLRAAGDRLERLARKMIGKYPNVRRWEDTTDLFQATSLKLIRMLERVELSDTRHFFAYAAEQMRRELIDLWRHYYGPQGHGANHASGVICSGDQERSVSAEPAAVQDDSDDLDRWGEFHTAVEQLEPESREVVSFLYYHGWTQQEVADCLKIDVRTVQRRWRRGLMKLQEVLRSPVA